MAWHGKQKGNECDNATDNAFGQPEIEAAPFALRALHIYLTYPEYAACLAILFYYAAAVYQSETVSVGYFT